MSKRSESAGRQLGARQLTAYPDVPDFRDWIYEPALVQLKRAIPRPRKLHILDQRDEGACTGFGLAAAINLLASRSARGLRASPWMLYEMAKRNDEWRGQSYEGSSCRGALKGWYNVGVCDERLWPAAAADPHVTLERARDARNNTVGAYYRIGPRISDYHAAINETGVIYCSASVHAGWDAVSARDGRIPYDDSRKPDGGHAFAIVGYNSSGFWIQNSWGRGWGQRGTALWSYLDWQANVMDAWVFRLALPTPQLWQLPPSTGSAASRPPARSEAAAPRAEIAGHFVHIDDGQFQPQGRYWSSAEDVEVTADCIAERPQYKHLLLYAHGGLNSPADSARRVAALVRTFKANGIYPYHFMYDTGLTEEIKDIVTTHSGPATERVAGLTDWSDRLIEWATRAPGRALWREMKRGARLPFEPGHAGYVVLERFLAALASHGRSDVQWHLVGHSTGSILIAHLLEALETLAPTHRIASCSLFAPAATVDLFKTHMRPHLITDDTECSIERMLLYALSARLELEDRVAGVYRKSLLHLVSRAFEESLDTPLLGLERFASEVTAPRLELVRSEGATVAAARCTASTHGGFDNDLATMNDLLRVILGAEPVTPFTPETLDY
jgi:Papain family cysteine protease